MLPADLSAAERKAQKKAEANLGPATQLSSDWRTLKGQVPLA